MRNKRVFPIRNFITNSLHNTNEAFLAICKVNNLTETIKNQTIQYTDEAMSRVASCGWISVHIFQCAYRNQHTVGENFTLFSDSSISLPHSSSICLSVMQLFFATYPLRDDSLLIFCLRTISEFHYYSQVNYFRDGDFKHHLLVDRHAL